jgi:isoamylase
VENFEYDTYGVLHEGDVVQITIPSRHATAVEVCFFEDAGSLTECRYSLTRHGNGLWRATIPGLRVGLLYGLRVHGPFEPQKGHRFNPSKLLVDPWARAITGEPRPDAALFGYEPRDNPDLSYSSTDNVSVMPRCVVVDSSFDWQGVERPRTPWSETLIYECHVRGLTMGHPLITPHLRGTFMGLTAAPMIQHLKSLGVTAVELLPVQQIAREPHLVSKGLSNYWGYSTLGFFAPHAGYCSAGRNGAPACGEQVTEFKTMVRELHRAGLEVILDVVYNHTAEAGFDGPTLSLRGLDNQAYYRLHRRNKRRYVDVTGCGNTLDLGRQAARELVLGSLRYWVREMGVDGFRFDLAPTLGRDRDGAFDRRSEFFQAVAADPVLADVKLIAEPWDVGPGGYQLGAMPDRWAEWNDRYRDAVRRFWRGSGGGQEVAVRIGGSRDIFPQKGPLGGVSFVACHDGYTLHDVTAYEGKHNEANQEDNRDGHDHNLGCNWGIEGETSDPRIVLARRHHRRNLLATLLFSRGVPMLSHGDELGRTQRGNNNAYCQDNEIAWVDWTAASLRAHGEDASWLAFVQRLAEIRRQHPALAANGGAITATSARGHELPPGDVHALALRYPPAGGEELLLLLNGCHVDVAFQTPPPTDAAAEANANGWTELLATASKAETEKASDNVVEPVVLEPFSLRLLRRAC